MQQQNLGLPWHEERELMFPITPIRQHVQNQRSSNVELARRVQPLQLIEGIATRDPNHHLENKRMAMMDSSRKNVEAHQ